MDPSNSTSSASSGSGATQPPSQPASQPAPAASTLRTAPNRSLPLRASTVIGAEDANPARRVSRKLQKKRRDGLHSPTMELPDRFKDFGDEAEREEDVHPGAYGGGFMNMNQSIFGLIAAAGSRVDFTDRFEGQSSDEEGDGEGGHHRRDGHAPSPLGGRTSQTTILPPPEASASKGAPKSHRRKISDSRLLKSVPALGRIASRTKAKLSKGKTLPDGQQQHHHVAGDESPISPIPESDALESSGFLEPAGAKLAPVMSRMLEARAEMAARPSFDLERLDTAGAAGDGSPTELAKKLMEIFEFDKPEEVIEGKECAYLGLNLADQSQEYPCWLLQNVLLQGYMYVTSRHIAFYAYLPKKAVSLSSSLSSAPTREMYVAECAGPKAHADPVA